MKTLKNIFASLILITFATVNVNAQATGNGDASATILEPLTITAVNDLEFGSIAAGASSSDVKISTSGGRSLESGDATLYTTDAGQQGTFDVAGENDATYSITLPENGVVTLTGPGTALVVKDFESDPAATGNGTLDTTGKQTINVGATIVIPTGQTAGSYIGSYDVTVNYN